MQVSFPWANVAQVENKGFEKLLREKIRLLFQDVHFIGSIEMSKVSTPRKRSASRRTGGVFDSVSYLWRWLRRKDWRDGMGEGQATPVLLLSGFLGAGKTTTLRHWIQNQRGLKLGCVVNDVASVNIDAKLIRRTHDAATSTLDLADTVELDNGCACCSITDELFDAIENLCYLADSRKQRFDWIVIEASGVAEPQNVRDLFQNAQEDKLPVSKMAYLDRIVTVVDASAFGEHYASKQMLVEKPELGEGGGRRPVVDLLIEQVECADFVLINKADRICKCKMKCLFDNSPSCDEGFAGSFKQRISFRAQKPRF
eukprot:jgi/Pico_ML_1/52730/g3396.t1